MTPTQKDLAFDAMEKALKPFVEFADALSDEVADNIALGIIAGGALRFGPSGCACVGDLRAAVTALALADKAVGK